MMTLMPYANIEWSSEELFEIEDRIVCCELTHYASRLLEKYFQDSTELEQTIQKAITVLKAANHPVSRHFRTVFLGSDQLTRDWMMSDLGLRLLLINADVTNPIVAKLQIEILSDGFDGLLHD